MAFKRKEFHKEENCLNCGYPLIGKYCGNCGQKAFLHKDSFLHMVAHFVGDYFHYDSKFWLTIKTLLTKPGLATLEYINGRRAKYLSPIQLYFFVTTMFFLLAFSISAHKREHREIEEKRMVDSLYKTNYKDTLIANGVRVDSAGDVDFKLQLPESEAENLLEYDSIQNSLPASRKDGILRNYLTRKLFSYDQKYKSGKRINEVFQEKLIHNIPKTFFLLLPYFAFLLLIVNFRKKIYYIDHIVFSLHFHAMLFMFLIGVTIIGELFEYDIVNACLLLLTIFGILIYLFLSLKRVYKSSFLRTLAKLIFLLTTYLIGFICVALILVLFTFLSL